MMHWVLVMRDVLYFFWFMSPIFFSIGFQMANEGDDETGMKVFGALMVLSQSSIAWFCFHHA